ncbi:hypothetical protein [Enterovibrio norvegicus]|uniref:hypothetical protein n=1 Tax=Enterovibrio norvegicus TaxID=188144 RepID=UPI000C81D485|nr:hypothetical protein [Enterovibrio norvegicus]PMN73181.1 hypothetical protein BCT27_12625 [Enterovibrio norvegicus]
MTNPISAPGTGLDFDELLVLTRHAAGISPADVAKELAVSAPVLKLIEQDIRRKLGAKSPMHMIARAFQLGILKALCLVLCFSFVTSVDTQATRTGSARTSMSRPARSRNDFI